MKIPTRKRIHTLYAICFSFGLLCSLFQITTLNTLAREKRTVPKASVALSKTIASLPDPQRAVQDSAEQSHVSKPVVSPNEQLVAITVVPLGTETAFLAQTEVRSYVTGELFRVFRGFTPRWLEDGSLLQVETNDRGLIIYDVNDLLSGDSLPDDLPIDLIDNLFPSGNGEPSVNLTPALLGSRSDTTGQNAHADQPRLFSTDTPATLPYPATIRVAHHPSNGCRDVPDWQIDIIPFEEYIARVVPAETPAWWPLDALAAQAVAARTYAWRKILINQRDYDVTDWANYQMMCDKRYPNSDTAVTMTQGQYLTTVDDANATPISAMYSAENGHPTLANINVRYLQAVPDLFAMGKERWGHGYGLSQWGAYRRAKAGQSYRQILGHYYSNVFLHNGLTPEQPTAALVRHDPPYTLGGNSIALQSILAPNLAFRYMISATEGISTSQIIERQSIEASAYVWRSPSPLPDGAAITASLWISDKQQDTITWQVDRQEPPIPLLTIPEVITSTLITLTIPNVQGQPLVSAGWQWHNDLLYHSPNSGELITDSAASSGVAWQADPNQHSPGVWYGPYTTVLPAKHRYRALYWLRADIPMTTTSPLLPVAHLDITDNEGRTILGLRDISAADFQAADTYQPIAVDFYLFTAPTGLEFRLSWPGLVGLALDRIEIWQLPDRMIVPSAAIQAVEQTGPTALFEWTTTTGMETGELGASEQLLQVRAADEAGNLSPVATHRLTTVDRSPPRFGTILEPQGWVSNSALTLTVTITDMGSGIDLEQGMLTLAQTPSGTVPISQPVALQMEQHNARATSATLRATLPPLADGLYTATIAIADQAGNVATMTHVLKIDTVAPTVTMTNSGTLINGWFTAPVTLTIHAEDHGSGIRERLFTQQPSTNHVRATSVYTAPVQLAISGMHTVTVWAIDHAFNGSVPLTTVLGIDLFPPTVTVTQRAVNSTTVSIEWHATDDGSGVATLELQLKREDDPWESLPGLYTHASSAITLPIATQQPSHFRIRATDHIGRVGEWRDLTLWVPSNWLYLPFVTRGE